MVLVCVVERAHRRYDWYRAQDEKSGRPHRGGEAKEWSGGQEDVDGMGLGLRCDSMTER